VEIILVRHGRPEPPATSLITGHQIGDFCRQYNALGISRTFPPPEATRARARCVGAMRRLQWT